MEDLKFIITNDRFGQLVITWTNPPGNDASFYPGQLKVLAGRLLELAESAPAMNDLLNS